MDWVFPKNDVCQPTSAKSIFEYTSMCEGRQVYTIPEKHLIVRPNFT